MLLGCIADDFTGASDLANTLAKGGMATVQFAGIPSRPAPDDCDAGVVALKTRSVAVEQAIEQSLAALRWLNAQGCKQILFKYCSTFDSTPFGNIGPVAEAMLEALDAEVAIICPAFPAAGRAVFMGHLFVNDRLLNESGMEKHPLNPMTDPDLRRWLRLQTKSDIGFVGHPTVHKGTVQIRKAIAAEAKAGRRLVVVDAIDDSDLLAIGAALADQKFVTGGSGIALGLPENFRKAGWLSESRPSFAPTQGPGIAFSGSCSRASQVQLENYLKTHPGFNIDPSELMGGKLTIDRALAWVREHLAQEPIVYSTADVTLVAEAQARFGREEVAKRIEGFFGALAARLVGEGVARIAVGGGETSGAIAGALVAGNLLIGPEIDPGIPALAVTDSRVRLALKSGNFGAPDFYEKALRTLGTA